MAIRREATAWVMMVAAVGIHVVDETLTDFLPYYNAQVLSLRARLGFFPAPIFTFPQWLGGLTAAVLLGFAATPLVARGGRTMRVVCGIVSALMIANACGHMLSSLHFGYLVPGFWSSPLLFIASIWMLRCVVGGDWSGHVRLKPNATVVSG